MTWRRSSWQSLEINSERKQENGNVFGHSCEAWGTFIKEFICQGKNAVIMGTGRERHWLKKLRYHFILVNTSWYDCRRHQGVAIVQKETSLNYHWWDIRLIIKMFILVVPMKCSFLWNVLQFIVCWIIGIFTKTPHRSYPFLRQREAMRWILCPSLHRYWSVFALRFPVRWHSSTNEILVIRRKKVTKLLMNLDHMYAVIIIKIWFGLFFRLWVVNGLWWSNFLLFRMLHHHLAW